MPGTIILIDKYLKRKEQCYLVNNNNFLFSKMYLCLSVCVCACVRVCVYVCVSAHAVCVVGYGGQRRVCDSENMEL